MGVVGEQVNEELKRYPATRTTLGSWVKENPNTMVMTIDTGHDRDYFRYPYGTYYTNDDLIFPVRNSEKVQGQIKDIVSYYWEQNSQTPVNEFSGIHLGIRWKDVEELGSLVKKIGDRTVAVRWDDELQSVRMYEENNELPASAAFSFVYPAFFQ